MGCTNGNVISITRILDHALIVTVINATVCFRDNKMLRHPFFHMMQERFCVRIA